MLTDANVTLYLESLLAKKRGTLSHSNDELIYELALIAFANLNDYFDPNADGPFQYRPLSSLTRDEMAPIDKLVHRGDTIKKIVLKDKVKALEMLIKSTKPAPRFGEWRDKHIEGVCPLCSK